MKGVTDRDWVQAILTSLLAGWIRLCLRTMRFTVENRAAVEALWASRSGAIVCFWHAGIALSAAAWKLDGTAQAPRVLVSRSRDGDFFARLGAKLGYPGIRGSSGKRTKKGAVKDKGGAVAFREVLRWIEAGNAVGIMPDGPRGPAEQMAEGPVVLAQTSGLPVLLLGLASAPAIRLPTWDRSYVPLPFSRGAIVWSDIMAARDVADTEAEAAAWGEQLSALTRRAEALVG